MAKRLPVVAPTLVVGHQRPDTDSAVSAAVYAALLNRIARHGETFEGVMLGEPSTQTRWLFESAGVALPRQVGDLVPRVRDAARRDVFTVSQNAALGDALRLIMRHHLSLVPVLDDRRRLAGVLSDRMPMAHYFYHANAEDFLGVLLSLDDLVRYLQLERWQAPTREADGQILLDPAHIEPGSVLLAGDQPELLPRAQAAGASAVIACVRERTATWKQAVQTARGLGVFRYRGSLMALAAETALAIPVDRLMQREGFPKLLPDQLLPEAQDLLRGTAFALPVVHPDNTLFGVLSRSEVLNFPRTRVVLVDHFEQHQAPEGIAQADIVEIVDHHRVGTIETTLPIRVDCRPVGSTATIIACKMREHGVRPTAAQARLLLGAIVADTLLLRSPTTTAVDRQQAAALARRAKVRLDRFGQAVLEQNDEALLRPAAELVEKDLKEFTSQGLKFAVAQIETLNRRRLDGPRLRSLARALRQRRERSAWDFALLMVTDILQGDSLVLGDARSAALARRILRGGGGSEVWPDCVSRKKQLLPELLRRLEREPP